VDCNSNETIDFYQNSPKNRTPETARMEGNEEGKGGLMGQV